MAGIYQNNDEKKCPPLSNVQIDNISDGVKDISIAYSSKQKKSGGISKKKQTGTKSTNVIKNKGKEIKRPSSQISYRNQRYESVFQKQDKTFNSSTKKTVNRLSSSDPSGDVILRKSISGEQLKGFRYSGSSSPSQSSDITKYSIFRGRGRRGSDSCPEKGYILPYGLRVQHAAHKCMWSGSESGSATSPAGSGSQPSGDAVGATRTNTILTESRKGSDYQSRIPVQKRQKGTKDFKFDAYMPLCEVQQSLKKGELIEGVLRINPRNYEDAYISAPDDQMDIYIGGIHDRNRSLHGDVVVVQLKHPKDWKILWEDLWDYQKQQNCKLIDFNMYNINKKHNKSLTKNVNKNKTPVENSIVIEENIKKKTKKNRNKINKKNITSLETEDIPREKNELNNCIPLNEEESSTSLNNSVYKPQCEEIEVDSKLHKEQECENKSDNLKQNSETTKQWTDSSSSLFIIPDDIVNCKSEFELPYFSDKTIDDDDNLLKSGSVAVAPEELSGDEFSQSLSGESTCSYHLDQLQEDNRFMECLQDEANNNEDNFTVNGENIINVNADQRDSDFNTFNQNTETYIQIGASTESVKYNNMEKDICTFDPSFSITYSNSNFNNNVPIDNTISDKCRTENLFINEKPIESEILDYKQEDSNNRTSITAKNEVSNNHRKIKNKNKKHKSKNSEITEETELNFHFLNVTQLMNHPHGSRFVQKTGKVVYILEKKNTRKAAGFLKLLQDKNDRWALFSPTDHKLPRIFIPMKECPQDFLVRPDDFAKYLFLAQIIEWNEDSKYAKGKLIQKLGETGEVEAETHGILFENGIDTNDFSDKIEKELNEYLEWTISEKDLVERRDFRKECVFTIDPSTARDLDDAVSCKLLQDGLYEVGVHIADVTYFVKENTALDATASDRATSIYLVQKVIPMLPPLLCERLCSLNPGEDRLTFSVIWKMNKEGEIFDEWFGRTLICSCMKLSYDHAQDMIEHPQKEWNISSELPAIHGDHKISDIIEKVICLNMIANKLREKRFRDGALRLDQVKLQFSLDRKTGLPSGFTIYEHRESNKLIEEFMLLANMAVAHRIYKSYPDQALLRRHPPPDKKMMNNIVNMCSAMGIELNSNSSGSLQASLNSLFGKDIYSKARIQVLTALCSKPMKCALYFNSGNLIDTSLYHHYALNVPLYTHFTSPIRRYPDIIVHRLLAASLDYCQPPNIEMKALQKLVDHCNDMKYTGKRVNEISSELFLFLFIKECGPLEEQAMVMGVMDHSFDVLLLRMGVVKRVYCDKLDLKKISYEKEKSVPVLTLIWNTETELKQQIKIFTLIDVIISVSSEETFRFNVVLKKPITTSIN